MMGMARMTNNNRENHITITIKGITGRSHESDGCGLSISKYNYA